jgi:hypothetical protein
MDDKKLHRCFTFSEEQLKHLRSKKYKIDRMECFMSLVDLAEPVAKLVQISKTKQVEILAGQVMVDNTQLAKLWDKDRKTVPKLLDAMETVGIFSSQEVEDNRIYTLHCLSGWYVDAKFVSNAFALKRNNDSTAIIHADVPVPKSSSTRMLMTRRRTRKVPLRAVTNPRTLPRATILRQLAMCRTNHHNLMIVAMWVSLEQMATSHHHLLKTIPLSLLTALRPKVKPMASRMKGR